MRYAIISDIHANLAAFEAVLADIESKGSVQKFWCLGDVVGYGPEPSACIRKLRSLDHICVAGNHDLGSIGAIGTEQFNPEAAAACEWTSHHLTPADVEYLTGLPLTIEEGDFTLAHGSPRDPVWEYVLSAGLAAANLNVLKTRFCLVGHSHVPVIFKTSANDDISGEMFTSDAGLKLGKERMIINPGAVGQPRDNDPRASYAIFDGQDLSITLHKVEYEVGSTQRRMLELGLPASLARRLTFGT